MIRSSDSSLDTRSLNWAMGAHLSALCLYLGLPLANLLFPYLIWLWQRKRSAYAAKHARAALNFQISITIVTLLALVVAIFLPPAWLVVVAVCFANIVFIGKAADRAKSGQSCRYPFYYPWIR